VQGRWQRTLQSADARALCPQPAGRELSCDPANPRTARAPTPEWPDITLVRSASCTAVAQRSRDDTDAAAALPLNSDQRLAPLASAGRCTTGEARSGQRFCNGPDHPPERGVARSAQVRPP
jgi:hypothetical protein